MPSVVPEGSTNGHVRQESKEPTDNESPPPFKVIIVGCGLGGLATAIELLRHEHGTHSDTAQSPPSKPIARTQVTILERVPELSEVGAGIQLPPNATRVMQKFGLLDKLYSAGMVARKTYNILRWQDGSTIGTCPRGEWTLRQFGNYQHVMHRADYQRVLVEEAERLGVEIRLGCDVVSVKCEYPPEARLADGQVVVGDVIVGADGLRSSVRTAVLGYVKEPEESGDLAFRITIPRKELENDPDPTIREIVKKGETGIWWGPNQHVVSYSVRNYELANLVLVCPDDLPHEVSKQPGDIEQMRKLFENWDPRLKALLSKVDKALKWKIWGMEELDKWTKGSTALIGDSCHPMVPYAALGAAMAVEDGAVLGRLIGLFVASAQDRESLPELLKLYQSVRKERTSTVVRTANENRTLYHMEDGPEQQKRDQDFARHDWDDPNEEFPWAYADLKHSRKLFGFDALESADDAWAKSTFAQGTNTEA